LPNDFPTEAEIARYRVPLHMALFFLTRFKIRLPSSMFLFKPKKDVDHITDREFDPEKEKDYKYWHPAWFTIGDAHDYLNIYACLDPFSPHFGDFRYHLLESLYRFMGRTL